MTTQSDKSSDIVISGDRKKKVDALWAELNGHQQSVVGDAVTAEEVSGKGGKSAKKSSASKKARSILSSIFGKKVATDIISRAAVTGRKVGGGERYGAALLASKKDEVIGQDRSAFQFFMARRESISGNAGTTNGTDAVVHLTHVESGLLSCIDTKGHIKSPSAVTDLVKVMMSAENEEDWSLLLTALEESRHKTACMTAFVERGGLRIIKHWVSHLHVKRGPGSLPLIRDILRVCLHLPVTFSALHKSQVVPVILDGLENDNYLYNPTIKSLGEELRSVWSSKMTPDAEYINAGKMLENDLRINKVKAPKVKWADDFGQRLTSRNEYFLHAKAVSDFQQYSWRYTRQRRRVLNQKLRTLDRDEIRAAMGRSVETVYRTPYGRIPSPAPGALLSPLDAPRERPLRVESQQPVVFPGLSFLKYARQQPEIEVGAKRSHEHIEPTTPRPPSRHVRKFFNKTDFSH